MMIIVLLSMNISYYIHILSVFRLPLGPSGREINGTRRFQKGYLAYAGAGKNSRGTQLILAFEDNLYLGTRYDVKMTRSKHRNEIIISLFRWW